MSERSHWSDRKYAAPYRSLQKLNWIEDRRGVEAAELEAKQMLGDMQYSLSEHAAIQEHWQCLRWKGLSVKLQFEAARRGDSQDLPELGEAMLREHFGEQYPNEVDAADALDQILELSRGESI